MPELPEVETVKRGLNEIIKRKKIKDVKIHKRQLRYLIPKSFKNNMINAGALLEVERRAKYLVFVFKHGYMINHLGMTGNWKLKKNDYKLEKHDHVELIMSDQQRLIYNDPRRFGSMIYEEDIDSFFKSKNHGPEPLGHSYNASYLLKKIANKSAPIKSVLMDQAVVLGVGNIYVSEALFRAKVSPLRPANALKPEEAKLVVKYCKTVLKEAIKAGGSTIKDFKKAGGESGYFQTRLKVYGREGQLCISCDLPIANVKLAGRSSFWCPHCQK